MGLYRSWYTDVSQIPDRHILSITVSVENVSQGPLSEHDYILLVKETIVGSWVIDRDLARQLGLAVLDSRADKAYHTGEGQETQIGSFISNGRLGLDDINSHPLADLGGFRHNRFHTCLNLLVSILDMQ